MKKTIAQDEDIGAVSAQSNFLIAKATVKPPAQSLTAKLAYPYRKCSYGTWQREPSPQAKPRRKSRRACSIEISVCLAWFEELHSPSMLTCVANIIARTDNLEFLTDLVPQTTTWRNHKAKKAREGTSLSKTEPLPLGQTTIDGTRPAPLVPKDVPILSSPSSSSPAVNGARPNSSHDLVFQHYEPNGTRKADEQGDVEMT